VELTTISGGQRHANPTADNVTVINKPNFEVQNTFYWTTDRLTATSLQPTPTSAYPNDTLWEAPDFATGAMGGRIWTLSGSATSPTSFTLDPAALGLSSYNEAANLPAGQKGTTVPIDADDGRFSSAAYAGNTVWATSNQNCTSGAVCAFFDVWSIDSNGEPTSQASTPFELDDNNWNSYYAAISTTGTSNPAVEGVVDFSCNSPTTCNPAEYPSSLVFQATPSGVLTYGSSDVVYGSVAATAGGGPNGTTRWGDYNGCDFWASGSTNNVACVGMFSQNNTVLADQALEVYEMKYP